MGKHLAKKLTGRKRLAYELHAAIGQAAKKTIESILELGVALKQIRDEKLYIELGHDNFESYTVEEWNISRRNAYHYIGVIEKLPAKFVKRVSQMTKPLSFRRLLALPNDTDALVKLTKEDLEVMSEMSDAEFRDEIMKLRGEYDRELHGGRGPTDLERPTISRDRYRDQLKKLSKLKEQLGTMKDEKAELIDEIEELEKALKDWERATSPDRDKQELISENKKLLLEIAKLKKKVDLNRMLSFSGELAKQHIVEIVGECAAVFNKLGNLLLYTHEEWAEFRIYTDTIRTLLEEAEERVAAVMAEKGLQPKDYEKWHDGSFRYHLDKATEKMKDDMIRKRDEEIAESKKKAKEERSRRKNNKKSK